MELHAVNFQGRRPERTLSAGPAGLKEPGQPPSRIITPVRKNLPTDDKIGQPDWTGKVCSREQLQPSRKTLCRHTTLFDPIVSDSSEPLGKKSTSPAFQLYDYKLMGYIGF
jgi:hypothetical protein